MQDNHQLYSMGNALVDYEIEVSEDFLNEMKVQKGAMTLVDQVRQTELLEKVKGHQHSRTCGGSAANTTIAFSQLGGSSYYSCKVGDDEAGKFYLDALTNNHVDSYHNKTNNSDQEDMTGKCLVFVTPDADRTMNTYLGASSTYSSVELNTEVLKKSSHLYVEGYLVTNPDACIAVKKSMEIAREHGLLISLTFSDPFIVGSFKDQFMDWLTIPVDLIFCNEEEAYSFTNSDKSESIESVGKKLLKYTKKFAITRGPKGAFLFDGNQEIDVATTAVKPIDTNGAGDIFAGAFLWGITHDLNFLKAGKLATAVASKLVTKFGARLKTEDVLKIKNEMI